MFQCLLLFEIEMYNSKVDKPEEGQKGQEINDTQNPFRLFSIHKI